MIARDTTTEAEVVWVEIEHDGERGYGEANPIDRYEESAESALAYVEEIADSLGDDPFAFEEIESRLPERELAARAGIDAALHDLCGKLTGLPVWRLLGLRQAGPPTSWTLGLGDPDETARKAEQARDFESLKLKLGGRDGLDVERVKAVREVWDKPIRVDVNEYWTLDEALESIPQLQALGVDYVEQPLPAGDPDGPKLKDALAAPDLRRRGLPHARRRGCLRRAGARDQHQAREVGRDPRGRPDGARGARARARRDARLHGRVGPRHRRGRVRREPLRPRRPRREHPHRRRPVARRPARRRRPAPRRHSRPWRPARST